MVGAFHSDERHLSRAHTSEYRFAALALTVEEEVVLAAYIVGTLGKEGSYRGTQGARVQILHVGVNVDLVFGVEVGHEKLVTGQPVLCAHHLHIVIAREQRMVLNYYLGLSAGFLPPTTPVVEAG